ncbi:hypothetical protein D3C81_1352320 [compost metagenome]
MQVAQGRRLRGLRVDVTGQAEIEDAHLTVRFQHQVRRFQVAVDEVHGVRLVHGVSDLVGDVERGLQVSLAAVHELAQGLAFDQFHDDGLARALAFDGEDAHEGRMLERSGQARFIDQFFRMQHVGLRFQAFQRHAAAQLGIPRFEYMAETAFAQQAAHFIVPADRVVLQWGLTQGVEQFHIPWLQSASTRASSIEKG